MSDISSETSVIEVTTTPQNREYFTRLLSFAREVLAVCDAMQVAPVLSGSLAVFAYTQNPTMEVHDVDLACSESQFSRLRQALVGRGITCRIRDWHVLQAVRDDLKVEFDAAEYWMQSLPDGHEAVKIGDLQFCTVSVEALQELYRRGLVDTAGKAGADAIKHRSIDEKLRYTAPLRPVRLR